MIWPFSSGLNPYWSPRTAAMMPSRPAAVSLVPTACRGSAGRGRYLEHWQPADEQSAVRVAVAAERAQRVEQGSGQHADAALCLVNEGVRVLDQITGQALQRGLPYPLDIGG